MPSDSTIDPAKLRGTVERLTEYLARGDYPGLCGFARRSRLSPQGIDEAIRQYGGRIIPPPAAAYRLLDVVAIKDMSPRRWSVVVPLWTNQEGRSDLSLEITVEDVVGRDYAVEIEDLHVL